MSQDNDVFSISLVDIIGFFKRRLKQIIFSGLFFATLAGVIAMLMEPIYQAETTILINNKQFNTLDTVALLPGQGGDTFAVDSEVQILKSPALLNAVAIKEKLYTREDFYKDTPSLMTLMGIWLGVHDEAPESQKALSDNDTLATDQTSENTEDKVVSNSDTQKNGLAYEALFKDWLKFVFPAPVPQTQALLEHKVLELLEDNLNVSRKGRSYVIAVTFDSPNPILATKIVNRLANEYLYNQRAIKQESTKNATKWLDERLDSLKKELSSKEEAIASFKERNNLYGATGVTQIERQLTNLNEQLIAARVETAEKQARYKQVQSLKRSGTLQSYSGFISSGTVTNLRLQEAKVLEEVADLSTRYGAQHPKLINAQAKLKNIQLQINNEADRMIANARSEYRIAQGRASSLQNSIATLKRKFDRTGSQAIRLQKLEREAETANIAYNTVAENFRKTDKTDKIQESDAQIISAAAVPVDPIKPRKGIIVLIGFFLGSLIGIGLILLQEILIKGFIDITQLEKATGLKVLGSVNHVNSSSLKLNRKKISIGEYLHHRSLTIFAEAIYRVRAAIEMKTNASPDDKTSNKVVLLTSSISGEGKSTLSLCYAISAAKTGKKVILLDTDFRRPILTKEVKPSLDFGLIDYLSQDDNSDVDTLINNTSYDNISFIGIKERHSQEGDLFKQDKFTKLMAYLRENYDLIIIDTPPISAVIDGCIIADYADHILYTVAWGNTPKDVILSSLKDFPKAVYEKISGLVFNKVHLNKAEKYGIYQNYKYNAQYYTDEA